MTQPDLPPPRGPPERKGGVSERILGDLLDYASTPWKAIVIVVLVLIGGAGWIAYEKRDQLFEAWMVPSEPTLLKNEISDGLDVLAKETDADLVQIWDVNLNNNRQCFQGARRHDGAVPVIPQPRCLPIFERESIRQDIKGVINVIEGHPTCLQLSHVGSPIARRLADRGMDHGCAIPIPPGPDAFVGIIYLAWSRPICTDGPEACAGDTSTENVAVSVAREVSKKLATH